MRSYFSNNFHPPCRFFTVLVFGRQVVYIIFKSFFASSSLSHYYITLHKIIHTHTACHAKSEFFSHFTIAVNFYYKIEGTSTIEYITLITLSFFYAIAAILVMIFSSFFLVFFCTLPSSLRDVKKEFYKHNERNFRAAENSLKKSGAVLWDEKVSLVSFFFFFWLTMTVV
jgi:hypothetical protein